uniref:Trimethylamine methyltransferase n=1 Tax=uncultured bacterium Contig19 TaxID=1393523 RepID=W0FKI3_9BACT|nr:trimethylamine methyltransferase [uncultured bacterium Contig19]
MSELTREQIIHNAAMKVMEEAGVAIHNDRAIEILQANGIRVEDRVAYFTEEQVLEWMGKAPETFTLYARNPKHDVFMGGNVVNAAPSYGCAFVDDWDGNRRTGQLADTVKALKLVQAEDVYDINGGIIVQPGDVPQEYATIAMLYADLMTSDKVIQLPTGYKEEMEVMLPALAELFGGKEAFAAKPRCISLINTVSPLSLDDRMLDCLMILAEYGQAVIVCPAAMLGATGSITMAGTIVSGVCESLAGICLAQMIRPGTPVVLGIQSTAADMRGGVTFACAAPEGTMMQGFAPNMAKFYGVPSRGGGCQTDSMYINAQAGYESMLTFYSAHNHGINIVMEAGGVMNSVNATSFEKMIIDFEIIRQVKFVHTPFAVDEESLNVEEIVELGQTGSFVDADSTLDNFDIVYQPHIGSRLPADEGQFKASIYKEMDRLLDAYDANRPQLADDERLAVRAALAKSGLADEWFDKIEKLATATE